MNESSVIGVCMTPQIVMPLGLSRDIGQLFLIGHGTLLVHEDGTKSKVQHGFAGVVYRRVEATQTYNMKVSLLSADDFMPYTAYFCALPLVNE